MTDQANDKARVAGGAGFALAGRLGAVIEAASFIAFTWFYGAATFGLYAVLWSYVKVSSAICEMAMTTALQRYVPKANKSDESQFVGFALKLSFIFGCVAAIAFSFVAPSLSGFINASETDQAHLVTILRIYIWVLPFWCLVNVATAAVRATRTFGPEVKVRIFYEQGIRLISASLFAFMGLLTYGLFMAHLVSVLLSAMLSLRLVSQYFNMRQISKASLTSPAAKEMWQYGSSVMPAYLIKMLFSEFPVIFLNMLLPGVSGAAAGGFYSVARKIASALQAVHKTFEYVMAPLAAEKDGSGDRKALLDMFAYATRLSLCIALPFAASLILARHDILSAMRPEFQVAGTAVIILCIGRVLEAATGPSAVIIEMLGNRLLPTVNGIIGFFTLALLGIYLIPEYGVTGAAISAAVGLNTTAYLSLIQSAILFKLHPFSKPLLRPLGVAVISTFIIIAISQPAVALPAPLGLITAVLCLIFSIGMLIRFGLSAADSAPFGKLARILRSAKE